MQLTRFDRWLRETFVHEIHIHTLSSPESLPKGIQRRAMQDSPGIRYKFHFVAKNTKAADRLIGQLKENSQMYSTEVVDRKAWFVRFIAPKQKSVTWWLFSTTLIVISLFFAFNYLKSFADDPEFRKNFSEALKILKQ